MRLTVSTTGSFWASRPRTPRRSWQLCCASATGLGVSCFSICFILLNLHRMSLVLAISPPPRVLLILIFSTGGLSFVLIFAWPLLTLPQVVFTKSYWGWWVAIAFIWGHFAAAITMILPMWEIRHGILEAFGCAAPGSAAAAQAAEDKLQQDKRDAKRVSRLHCVLALDCFSPVSLCVRIAFRVSDRGWGLRHRRGWHQRRLLRPPNRAQARRAHPRPAKPCPP